MKAAVPAQKRGESKQDYATPPEFLDAVRFRWHIERFDIDLAASENNVGSRRIITPEDDSLAVDWNAFAGDLWLNPPFANITPWAEKCANSTMDQRFTQLRRIFFLVPAAVGSRWFERYVHPFARVYFLRDRICFDGKHPYPKDCILAVYGEHPGYEFWAWKTRKETFTRMNSLKPPFREAKHG